MTDSNDDNTITIEAQPKEKKKRVKRSADYKRAKVITMHAQGVPNCDIARAVDLKPERVRDIIERFKPVFKNLDRVHEYRDIKSDILASAQLAALESALSGNKLAKAGFLPTLQGFDILNKAERLDRDQSTDNISHRIFGKVTIGDGSK